MVFSFNFPASPGEGGRKRGVEEVEDERQVGANIRILCCLNFRPFRDLYLSIQKNALANNVKVQICRYLGESCP